MASVKVYNLEGKEMEKLELADGVFAVPRNDDLIHQVAVTIAGNQRIALAHTKNRGERAGSGKKPWKQKGTGRARVGSVRTPLWKKGGVAFGPRSERNFKHKINDKMNAKAITMVLSGKLKDSELVVIDKLELKEKKTKKMAESLNNLKIKGRMLIAFSDGEKGLRIVSRNINKVENILAAQLNVWDMLNNKYLVMSKESVKMLEDKYGKSKKAK
jgi:large subunit ribosomal protein L4